MIYFYLFPKSFPIIGTFARGFELELLLPDDVVFLLAADVVLAEPDDDLFCADAMCTNWLVRATKDMTMIADIATVAISAVRRFITIGQRLRLSLINFWIQFQ